MPKFTEAGIKNLKPSDKRYKMFDGEGLYIEVLPSGSRVWWIKYKKACKNKRITLGQYPSISLKNARDTLPNVRIMLLENRDSSEQLREKAVVEKHTFQNVATDSTTVKKRAGRRIHSCP